MALMRNGFVISFVALVSFMIVGCEHDDDSTNDLLPAQFVIGQDGLIKFVNYGDDQTGWIPPDDVLSELAKL